MGQVKVCANQWGRSEIVDHLPLVRMVQDAIYLPWRADRDSWGVFYSDGTPIQEAINYRGSLYEVSGPSMRFCAESAAKAVRHEVDTMMYGGILLRHFGHFIVDSFPRFWPKLQSGCPPILCHFEGPRTFFVNGFASKLIGPLGIHISDLAAPETAVRIRNLYVPASAFHEQMAAHKVLGTMGDRVAKAFSTPYDTYAAPVYLSKTRLAGGVGRFAGETKIEEAMLAIGAQIAYPETLSIPQQISLISGAPIVCGTVGSSLHVTLFAREKRHIVALNPNADVNSNFILIDRICGNTATYLHTDMIESKSGSVFLTNHQLQDPVGLAGEFAAIVDEQMRSI